MLRPAVLPWRPLQFGGTNALLLQARFFSSPPHLKRALLATPKTKTQKRRRQLPADHQLDLPLWLVRPLHERHIVDAQLPSAYSER